MKTKKEPAVKDIEELGQFYREKSKTISPELRQHWNPQNNYSASPELRQHWNPQNNYSASPELRQHWNPQNNYSASPELRQHWNPQNNYSKKQQVINDIKELRQLYDELYSRPMEHPADQMIKNVRVKELESNYPNYKGKSAQAMYEQLLKDYPPETSKSSHIQSNLPQAIRDIFELLQLKELLERGSIITEKQYQHMKARVAQLEGKYPECANLNSNQLNNVLFKLAPNNHDMQIRHNEAHATVYSEHIHQTKSDYVLKYNKIPQPAKGTTGLHMDFPTKEERINFLFEQAKKGREFIATDDNNKVMAYAKDGVLYHGNHEVYEKGDSLQSSDISKEEFREAFENRSTCSRLR